MEEGRLLRVRPHVEGARVESLAGLESENFTGKIKVTNGIFYVRQSDLCSRSLLRHKSKEAFSS